MREDMIYNPNFYQFREFQIERILKIIRNRKKAEHGGIVFLGDSITELYDIDKYYNHIDNKYNCGISGITSKALLWVIDEVCIKYKPKKVVFMIGTNDLGDTTMSSPREIASNIKDIVTLIIKNLEDLEVKIISTLPCDEHRHGYKLGRGLRSNDLIRIIYKETVKLLNEYNNLEFIDVFDEFIDNSHNLKEEYTTDGLHLNERAYDIYTELIKSYI